MTRHWSDARPARFTIPDKPVGRDRRPAASRRWRRTAAPMVRLAALHRSTRMRWQSRACFCSSRETVQSGVLRGVAGSPPGPYTVWRGASLTQRSWAPQKAREHPIASILVARSEDQDLHFTAGAACGKDIGRRRNSFDPDLGCRKVHGVAARTPVCILLAVLRGGTIVPTLGHPSIGYAERARIEVTDLPFGGLSRKRSRHTQQGRQEGQRNRSHVCLRSARDQTARRFAGCPGPRTGSCFLPPGASALPARVTNPDTPAAPGRRPAARRRCRTARRGRFPARSHGGRS